ncbi:MAG: NAD-dependent epimerase/dehydratase family protein [Acidimicrobiia bacterium]
MGEQRLLVIGVGSELGSLTTTLLEADARFADIVGIDVHPPRRRLRRTEYLRVEHADTSEFVRRVVGHRPDVIVHLGVWEPHARLGTDAARIATGDYARGLCEALVRLDGLSRLVVRSGIEVYGAPLREGPNESAVVAPTSTYGHMLASLEAMVADSAPATATVTTLRLAPVIGAHVPSPLGRLFRLPVVPIDPLSRTTFQVVADDDAARAVVHAATHGHHGAVNVAAVDAITVASAMRRGRRLVAPVLPQAWPLAASLTTLAGAPLPDHVRELLRQGRNASTQVHDIGYQPMHTTSDVIARLYSWPSIVRIAPNHPTERAA